MPRFFVRNNQISEGIITVQGDDAHHLSRSLRVAVGETVVICDENACEYLCELTDFLPNRVLARVLSTHSCEAEPPFFAHVFQALPKGDKLDSIIQKAIECGASALTTFESERCVVRMKDGSEGKKQERRARIAIEAAKQSGRGRLPEVHSTLRFSEAIDQAAKCELALFCYEGEGTLPLGRVLADWQRKNTTETAPSSISIVVGSEGGFSEAEVAHAKACGMIPIGLGPRILRTETAASFVLGCLVMAFELS